MLDPVGPHVAHQQTHLVAREFGHEEVFRLLMERSPEELKLAQACELGDEAVFNALLAQRPALADEISAVLSQREAGLAAVRDRLDEESERKKALQNHGDLLSRIRRYFTTDAGS